MTEPPQTAERRQVLEDALARVPRIDIVWHQPPTLTADDDALTVLATVLSGGRSSRFYESLVRTKQLTQGVSASAGSTRGPALFSVGGSVLQGKTVADLEQAIYAEIERVKTGPIADWEIEKARNTQKRQFVSGLGSSLQRAVLLGQYALFYNDPDLINTYTARLNKVTAADLQRVAKQYLVETNRTVVITNPKATGAPEGGR
jgi:predicted Zn-dependent peptidase